jgi:hypothetical protein
MKVNRIEIWTDVKANSGTHQATIASQDLFGAILEEDVNGVSIINIAFARDSIAWDSVENYRVLRVIDVEGEIAEFRITKPSDGRAKDGGEIARIKGVGILNDLRNGIVSRDEYNGAVTLYYTLLSLTRTELVTLIVAAAPSYFAVGTIDGGNTKVQTFTFNFDTPLSALQELAEMEGLELAVRRNGDTNYLVDLVVQIGSSATQPEFRYRKSLEGVTRDVDSSEMANRIYPAGASDGVIRLSVAEATWKVTTVVDTTTIELDGDPIYEDDVFNGKYLERVSDSSRFQITDSDATLQRVTTGAAHGLSVGDLVKFRIDTNGKRLTYVESLIQQAVYGLISGTSEETDLPMVDNLVSNPALSEWSGGLPVDWSAISTPTIAENTNALYTMVGGSSAKVTATADAQGIKTAAITIAPSDPHIFFSAFVSIFVESGQVEMYLEHSTEGRFPLAGYAEAAVTSEHNKFIDLIIAGKEWPAGTVTINVVAVNGAATFYVDAAQLTNTAAEYPFYDGNAARTLWQRGLVALDERSIPLVSYDINTLDLYAMDSSLYPYDKVTIGGNVLVEDEMLDYQVITRAIKVKRDLLQSHNISITLSNKPADLIDILTRRGRRVRQNTSVRPAIATIDSFIVSHQNDGTVTLQVFGSNGCRSFRYIADTGVMPTVGEVIASGGDGITNNTVDGTEVEVTSIRNQPTNPKIGKGGRVFVRAVAYPILNAGGIPGATKVGTIIPVNYWSAEFTADSIASESGSSPNIRVSRKYTVDTRATAVKVYRKKGGWPTITGVIDGPVDPAYDRGTVSLEDTWTYVDGGYTTSEVVYDVAIAYDINGNQGERENKSYIVTGSPLPQITTAWRVQDDAGTNCVGDKRSVTCHWTVANSISSDKMYVRRQVDGGPILGVSGSPVTDPTTNTSLQDNNAPMYGGGEDDRHCDYILELWDSTDTTKYDSVVLQEDNPHNWNLCITPYKYEWNWNSNRRRHGSCTKPILESRIKSQY